MPELSLSYRLNTLVAVHSSLSLLILGGWWMDEWMVGDGYILFLFVYRIRFYGCISEVEMAVMKCFAAFTSNFSFLCFLFVVWEYGKWAGL